MKWPADGKLTVEGVTPKIESATFLTPGAAIDPHASSAIILAIF